MRIISTSAAIAELLPEVFYALDPDVPLDNEELPRSLRRYINNLIMAAFFYRSVDDIFDNDWLTKIRRDPSFLMVSRFRWVELDVIDTEGTYILIIEENQR